MVCLGGPLYNGNCVCKGLNWVVWKELKCVCLSMVWKGLKCRPHGRCTAGVRVESDWTHS